MVRVRPAEKREKFLKAALKLFVEKGVQNTATAEIAREAGTAAGTLFLYFSTKQALINALLLEIGRDQAEFINGLLEPSLSAQETFLKIWNGSIDWFINNMDAYQYIQQIRDTEMVPDEVVQESNSYFRYYYEAIQKGLQEQVIKPYPVELIGGILYQSVIAVLNIIRMQHDPAARAETIRMGFDIFWNGIKK